jgi:hypothetical protein
MQDTTKLSSEDFDLGDSKETTQTNNQGEEELTSSQVNTNLFIQANNT